MSEKETWDIKDISEETHELVKKAARHDKMKIHDWVEMTLKNAAHGALEPEKIITDPAKLGMLLTRIDRRLAHMENNPLHQGARVVTDGAKALGESAREIYERVEARKWFDKSYEMAGKACGILSQHFKAWWESRGGHTTSNTDISSTQPTEHTTIVEAEVVEETPVADHKPKKDKGYTAE